VDFNLYLPRCWTDDPARRREARIPAGIGFRTKPELALDMIRRAVADGLPRGIVLADSAYGSSSAFRTELRDLGLEYAVAVYPQTKVWCTDRLLRRRGPALSVRDLATSIGRQGFRRVTWREGTKQKLRANFAMRRVVPFHDDGVDPAVREDVWLVMEWPDGEDAPTKYYLASLPRRVTKKQLVRTIKQRWRTERMYEDFKGELGLDHFEGRRYQGWHHHVSVALCVYAFVAAEQARRFPPQTRRTVGHNSEPVTAPAPLLRFLRHRPSGDRVSFGRLASTLPSMPPAPISSKGPLVGERGSSERTTPCLTQ
jgi:SRSO17 transposase